LGNAFGYPPKLASIKITLLNLLELHLTTLLTFSFLQRHFLKTLIISFPDFRLVLHREARHVLHHHLAAIVRSLRGRQLGRGQGLPLHHDHLQPLHLSRPLRALPLLLRN